MYTVEKLQSHFALLEQCLRSEMMPTGYKFYTESNFLAATPSIFLEVELPHQDILVRVTTYLTTDFPKKPPRLYLQTRGSFTKVDSITHEINYVDLYAWRDNHARLSDLFRALEIYFRTSSASISGETPAGDSTITSIRRDLQRIKASGTNALIESLPFEQVRLLGQNKNVENIVRSAPIFRELYSKIVELHSKTIKDTSEILQQDSETALSLGKGSAQVEGQEQIRRKYQEDLDKYKTVTQRFSTNNILQFLDSIIKREQTLIESLQGDIQREGLANFDKVEALCQKNQNLNFYQQLLRLLK